MRRLAAGVAVLSLLALTGGATAADKPLFEFGTVEGTRLPFKATVAATGVVTVSGSARQLGPVTLSKPARDGLLRLARTGGFFSLPGRIRCANQPGGLSTTYIRVHTAKLDKTVYEYGGCKPAFDELFALLKAAAAIQ